jgi:hypothetical protein
MRSLHSALIRRSAAVGLAGALAAFTVVASSGAASAGSKIHATYPVSGSTFLKAPNFTLALGPGKLVSTVDATTGKLTATLTLPNATGSFKQLGLIPVSATTQFINDGPTTGTLNLNTGVIHSTSKITLKIVSLSVAGLPVPVGNSCETAAPVVVKVTSQKGFSVLQGGKLAGSYSVGKFAHCLLATSLINLTLPGSGNTISLTLGKPKLSS